VVFVNVGVNTYFYFQKIEHITISDNTKNNEEMKKDVEKLLK